MISAEEYRYLRQMDDFKYLSIEQFDELSSHMREHRVKKNQILFFEGDSWDRLYFSQSGYFKLEQDDPTGKFVYADFVKNNTIFPYEGLFLYDNHHLTATALTDATYYLFPRQMYIKMTDQNIPALQNLNTKLSKLLMIHELRLRQLITPSAADRVVQFLSLLLYEMGDKEGKIPFMLTQDEIGVMSGTTRETVSHVMRGLERQKRLGFVDRKLTFFDKKFFLESVEDKFSF